MKRMIAAAIVVLFSALFVGCGKKEAAPAVAPAADAPADAPTTNAPSIDEGNRGGAKHQGP